MNWVITMLASLAPGCVLCQSIEELVTWDHDNAELNDSTEVAPGAVRRSTIYDVRVATVAAPESLRDSFTYMTLPRGGRAKEGYGYEDGADFADQANMTMSWTSFLYGVDTWVHVEIKDGSTLGSVDDVMIRPTTLAFPKELVDARTVRILVPYSVHGYRFSVEFASQQLTSYMDGGGGLTTNAAGNPAVHTEPLNAMLIFAHPIRTGAEADWLVPDPLVHSIHYPEEGRVTNLHEVTQEVIYFRPGTYEMGWNYHATLRENVTWVYLAPGAYVKGAFQFRSVQPSLKVTGFGVLSGEQYVYEPDRANRYRHRSDLVRDCHATCVKMLEFTSSPAQQQLTVHGITIANPPYHSFVTYGDLGTFTAEMTEVKQVGGWYWQTDGPELYAESSVRHSFFHSNDDVLKLYASGAEVHDVVVWKAENGPVIQWGWAPRTMHDVHVNGVEVIHNRMHRDDHNSCIINSARHFRDPSSRSLADPKTRVSRLLLENIRSEGRNLCAMRLYALSSWEDINIVNLWIEEWNELAVEAQASKFEALYSPTGERVFVGNEISAGRGVGIVNYVVGGERISKAAENWRSHEVGRLDFDPSLWENWNAW